MLRELPAKQKKTGDQNRRWFFCQELDLVVWLDAAENLTGFQLAYNKYRDEHSISWNIDCGFRHYAVDEGNPLPGESETPLLYPDGSFNSAPVIELFKTLSVEIPQHIAHFVIEKLSSYRP